MGYDFTVLLLVIAWRKLDNGWWWLSFIVRVCSWGLDLQFYWK
jgi:hypothetical protein